jgi:amino acid permease
MTTMYPVSGAFVHYASRFCDPALGFALGEQFSRFLFFRLSLNYRLFSLLFIALRSSTLQDGTTGLPGL